MAGEDLTPISVEQVDHAAWRVRTVGPADDLGARDADAEMLAVAGRQVVEYWTQWAEPWIRPTPPTPMLYPALTAFDALAWQTYNNQFVPPNPPINRYYDWASRREADEANAVARELLREHLSEEQRARFDQHGTFHVVPATPGAFTQRNGNMAIPYFYKVTQRQAYNVDAFQGSPDHKGRLLAQLCTTAARVWIPTFDKMLADKLLLESDEEAYLDVANVNPIPSLSDYA